MQLNTEVDVQSIMITFICFIKLICAIHGVQQGI